MQTLDGGNQNRMRPPDRPPLRRRYLALLLLAGLSFLGVQRGRRAEAASRLFVATYSTTPRIPEQIDRLDRLAKQKLWDDWLRAYQELVDLPLNPIAPQEDWLFFGVRYRCHQLLAALPVAVRQRYRLAYDGEALHAYETALHDGDPAAMREVYSRYRFTTYGPRALQWMADIALDRGEFELADLAYRRFLAENPANPLVLLHRAAAANGAGKGAEARAALERIRKEFAATPLTFGGRKMTAGAAAELVARAIGAPAPPAPVPARFAGADGSRRMAALQPLAPSPAWQFRFPTQTKLDGSAHSHRDGEPDRLLDNFHFLSFPAGSGQQVFVQGPRDLAALDPTTGKLLWDQKEFSASEEEVPDLVEDSGRWSEAFPTGRPVQAAPVVAGDWVYARVALSYRRDNEDYWPADFALAALDTRTGAVLWRRQAGGEPAGEFYDLPSVSTNMVFTGSATVASGLTACRAVALDAGSGETLWSTYLGGGSHPLGAADGSPPLIRNDEVWVESTLHTLTALDLLTGEIRLVFRADVYTRGSGEGPVEGPIVDHPITLLAAHDGHLLWAPRWGGQVIAFDPASGRVNWTVDKATNRSGNWTGVLFGLDDQRLYLTGRSLQAIDVSTGKTAWTWKPRGGDASAGYPALVGDRIYFPVDGRIQVLSAADGKEQESLDLTDALGGHSSVPTLTVLDHELLATTEDRVVALREK